MLLSWVHIKVGKRDIGSVNFETGPAVMNLFQLIITVTNPSFIYIIQHFVLWSVLLVALIIGVYKPEGIIFLLDIPYSYI